MVVLGVSLMDLRVGQENPGDDEYIVCGKSVGGRLIKLWLICTLAEVTHASV